MVHIYVNYIMIYNAVINVVHMKLIKMYCCDIVKLMLVFWKL